VEQLHGDPLVLVLGLRFVRLDLLLHLQLPLRRGRERLRDGLLLYGVAAICQLLVHLLHNVLQVRLAILVSHVRHVVDDLLVLDLQRLHLGGTVVLFLPLAVVLVHLGALPLFSEVELGLLRVLLFSGGELRERRVRDLLRRHANRRGWRGERSELNER
jgi:hypothetical protein